MEAIVTANYIQMNKQTDTIFIIQTIITKSCNLFKVWPNDFCFKVPFLPVSFKIATLSLSFTLIGTNWTQVPNSKNFSLLNIFATTKDFIIKIGKHESYTNLGYAPYRLTTLSNPFTSYVTCFPIVGVWWWQY